MSSALITAIYRRLVGQEVLTGSYLTAQQILARLLGTDPDTGLPSVHKGNSSDVVTYPAITYRESAGIVDKRFTHGQSAVGIVSVDDPIYDFEIWGLSRSGTELSGIDDAFMLLMDQRKGVPRLPVASGAIDQMVSFMTPVSIYDDIRHAWCLIRRIQFKERFSG
jgi:hypothetical protein